MSNKVPFRGHLVSRWRIKHCQQCKCIYLSPLAHPPHPPLESDYYSGNSEVSSPLERAMSVVDEEEAWPETESESELSERNEWMETEL